MYHACSPFLPPFPEPAITGLVPHLLGDNYLANTLPSGLTFIVVVLGMMYSLALMAPPPTSSDHIF